MGLQATLTASLTMAGRKPVQDQLRPDSIPVCASMCTSALDPVPEEVAALVQASIAESTRRAYRSDLPHFAAWGRRLPAEPVLVASYLAAHAEKLSVPTLVRRVATISKAHEAKRLPNFSRSNRASHAAGRQAHARDRPARTKPLLREDLFRVLDAMGEGVKDVRDLALLLIGFAGRLRRWEIVGFNWRRRRARPRSASPMRNGILIRHRPPRHFGPFDTSHRSSL
jgi:hypothetical protein